MSDLDIIREKCENCTFCALGKTKTNTVFGVGNPRAALMFVGEAPGENEDKTGIPFVGAAGQLFDKYLVAVGIRREVGACHRYVRGLKHPRLRSCHR